MYIHVMKEARRDGRPAVVPLPCASANLRRAARIVSQLYEHHMQEAGLKGTQFTLLQALTIAGNITQGKLGEVLGLDSTTLTRTLGLLRKKRWIQATPGEDRRELRLSLTEDGKRKYQRALPYWKSAQKELRRLLGEKGWQQLMQTTIRTAGLTQQYSALTK